MIDLTVQAIKDVQVCERYYDYMYRDGLYAAVNGREILADRFENTLKRVAGFFFYKKQSAAVPSYNALVNRWERLWFPKEMDAYDLAVEQHESAHHNLASYSNVAVANLIQFYEDFEKETSEVLVLDEDYILPIDADLVLKGKIDLVLRKKNNYTVIKWVARTKRPSIASLEFDLAALRAAFEYRNQGKGRVGSVNYKLYDLGSTNPGLVDVTVEQSSVAALAFWARHARDNKVFIPRRGYTSYCKGCPYDLECSKWNAWSSVAITAGASK